jgi:symplekin
MKTVKDRLIALAQSQTDAANAASAASASSFVEDDEEYEPVFEPIEDAEQLKNRLDMESSEDLGIGIPKPSQVHLGPFSLPPPQPLSDADLTSLTTAMMNNLFTAIGASPSSIQQSGSKPGLNRVAANMGDRNSLVTTLSRLITRPAAGLLAETADKTKKKEVTDGDFSIPRVQSLGNLGRYRLLQYILTDWTKRMEVATTWLTEEWYNDQMCRRAYDEQQTKDDLLPPEPNFPRWASRFLDELSAFIGSEHNKLLIRFVSDVPGLDAGIIGKVKHLATDPERVTMVVQVLQYVIRTCVCIPANLFY